MKFRSTFLLLVMALGIGGYIWFVEKKQLSTDEREEKEKLVFSVTADDIDRIELVRDKDPVALAKATDGTWNLEKPLHYKADVHQLRGILHRIEALKSERVIPAAAVDEKKVEEFGLVKPRITVRFRASGKERGLAVGEDTPLGETAYARVEGANDVHVVAKSLYAALNKEVKDLRDRGVIEFEQADLSKVVVTRGGKSVELARENEEWRIVSPVSGAADPDKVNGLLRKLRNLRVRDFVDDAPRELEKYGLAAPAADIALTGKNGEAAGTILFGNEGEKGVRYVRTAGRAAVLAVGDTVLKDVVSDADALRDRKVTRLGEAQVREVRIERGGGTLALAKVGQKWEIREPEKIDADAAAAIGLLKAITDLQVLDFVADRAEDPAKYGLGEGALALTLKTTDDKEERILVGSAYERGKKVYLTRARGDEILGASAEFLDWCAIDPLRYIKKQVVEFSAPTAKKVTISGPKITKTVCEREGNLWQLLEPKKGTADAAAVTGITTALARLNALQIVARSPKDLKQYGLEPPALEVAIECEKGGSRETTTLKVGKKTHNGAFYATLASGDLVFTIPSLLEASLRKDLALKPVPTPASAPAAAGQHKDGSAESEGGAGEKR